MTDAAVVDLLSALADLSGPAVLAFLVILLLRGDVVTRRSHERVVEQVEQDRDQWRHVAMEALNVTEAAVGRRDG